ncbi:nucleotidyltransferase domain-containing protein [Halorhabdus sp. CUG00001]|uniref:nucleotidyltransferase domain-containing protein n=1 Tax=Halorhabdus sp. CUG00001 TaxID=2600297 RepID=UPI00131EA12A|nr:nucleotidyltransferase domain-containing protein [Halorhabdus sp. CUG00001]
MQAYHRDALETAVDVAESDEDILACILTGSLARGWERSDSDVDVIFVVTDEDYDRRRADWDLHYHHDDPCDHEDIYIDGKIVDVEFLEEVADHGSEPARAAFVGAEVEYSTDARISELLETIPVYPTENKSERIRTFYSQMEAYNWYVGEANTRSDAYLGHHTTAQLALFGGRLLLAHNETLFPYHKWFSRVLREVPEKPEGTMDVFDRLLEDGTPEAAEAFTTAIREYRDWETPEVGWPTRFLLDREWQWRDGQPALEEL